MASTESGFSASKPHPQAASSGDGQAGAIEPDRADDWDDSVSPYVLRVPSAELFLAPAACACCLGVAAQSLLVRGNAGETVSVNYCEECLRHASAERTRRLSLCLASVILGVSVALASPVVLPSLGAGWLTFAAFAGAVVPIALGLGWRRQPEAGHASPGEAVWWWKAEHLCCANLRYAKSAARSNRLELSRARPLLPRWTSWYVVGLLATLIALPASIVFNTARLRVLNLTDSEFTLIVDGRVVGTVEHTSAESPEAGREFRLGAGMRRLAAISQEGSLLFEREVLLVGGAQHLYAPASPDTCFWLEFTSYGRQKPAGPPRLELARGVGFWALQESVDTWFAPSPLPAADDDRSSGGRLIALRQAPCSAGTPP